MATQHAGSSTAEPREDTPLLQADAHSNPDATAGQTNDNGDNNGRLSQSANAITSSTHPPLARIDKAIFIMSALLITTAIISFAFYLANIRLLAVGSRFGFLEFQIHGRMTFFCWFVASIFVAAFNVARLKRQGNTLPSVINILFFGVGGFFLTLLSLDESIDRFTRPPYYCTRDLKGGPDDADDGLQYYEGTYQECLEWAPTYDVVTWFYLFFLSVTSVLMLAIAITFFSKVYQQGSQFASNSGAFLSSRFSIPAGHLSFEVALRWGGQQQQPRRDEESRGGEDQ